MERWSVLGLRDRWGEPKGRVQPRAGCSRDSRRDAGATKTWRLTIEKGDDEFIGTMRRNLVFVFFVFFAASLATAQRLPELAVPESYQLSFAPNFDKDNFAGEETIQIRVLKPTSTIVLNAAAIEFQDASIASGGATQKAKVTLDKDREMATLAVAMLLQPGAATIRIRYTGILNNELRGFYLGKLGDGKKYAATQFEATDARRAFPSFDEPAYKATFDITVVADKGHVAISN